MKTVSNTRSQKTNTSRKTDVKVTLNLTAEQAERLAVLAKLNHATSETLAIATIFADFDSWDNWHEYAEFIDGQISYYAEEPKEASDKEPGLRLEDQAPARWKLVAGYVSPEVGGEKEVAHA